MLRRRPLPINVIPSRNAARNPYDVTLEFEESKGFSVVIKNKEVNEKIVESKRYHPMNCDK